MSNREETLLLKKLSVGRPKQSRGDQVDYLPVDDFTVGDGKLEFCAAVVEFARKRAVG